MSKIRLIIFDLDGTLLNTIYDLANGANFALERSGFPTHHVDEYKYFVGNGINKLFERALPENQKTVENIQRIRDIFIPYYEEHNADFTRPYEGISELLTGLQDRGLKIAVASNKYQQGTEELVKRFYPEIRFSAVFGQREGVPAKPNPKVIFEILQKVRISARETLYVGDSGVDMQTALNAGIAPVGVAWGFRPREELERYGAKHIINTPADLWKFFGN
ncbi:MAG: HAD family hydrolase [Tannerella sp.]|jgi:phosphoglycolate phosphatase|nr:HAD family hydrolase [Tannerella sp.]